MYQPVTGNGSPVIPGDETVQGNLLVNGTSNLNGLVTAGSGVNVTGAVNATGAVSGSSVTASGAVTAGSLSVTGGSAVVALTATGTVTAPNFTNSSYTQRVIQIVDNGVPIAGVTVGSSGAGNNLLILDMTALFPGSVNFKSYKVFLSGSSTNRFVGWNNATSGGTGTGAFLAQFQSLSGYDIALNYKGNCAVTGTSVGAGGGGVANYPDSVIVCPADLSNNIIYYTGTTSNGATAATNANGTIIWLTFLPIL